LQHIDRLDQHQNIQNQTKYANLDEAASEDGFEKTNLHVVPDSKAPRIEYMKTIRLGKTGPVKLLRCHLNRLSAFCQGPHDMVSVAKCPACSDLPIGKLRLC
jgi:hypothetical protein